MLTLIVIWNSMHKTYFVRQTVLSCKNFTKLQVLIIAQRIYTEAE